MGRDGRVIDLHVLTGREGGRRRGRERCMWGGRVWYCAVMMRVGRRRSGTRATKAVGLWRNETAPSGGAGTDGARAVGW